MAGEKDKKDVEKEKEEEKMKPQTTGPDTAPTSEEEKIKESKVPKKTKKEETKTLSPKKVEGKKATAKSAASTEKERYVVREGEKIFTIPLRKCFRKPLRKRAPYALRLIREFLSRHMKIDKEKVKLGKYLNEEVWKNGIKNPPRRIRVKAFRDKEFVKAELLGYNYVDFVAKKKEAKATGLMEKMRQRMTPKEIQKQEQEDLIEGRKKKAKEKEKSKPATEK